MNKNTIYKLGKAAFNLYVQDYEVQIENEDISDSYLEAIISDDLMDKNFTSDEIEALLGNDLPNYDIMCKFIAYTIALYNSYETIEQLNKNIKESFGFSLDQDDLEHIMAKSEELGDIM